ncbi:MAG: choice-of-anchor D domain-containing protein [Planctomycetes bacterium]|nr:choice-of-anchor D domain-containing protein [Planctomycetota bacterium]
MTKKLFLSAILMTVFVVGCNVDINPGSGGVTISTTSHDFGTIIIGDIVQFDLYLTNNTTDRITLNQIQLEGSDLSDFVITKGGYYPLDVDPANEHMIRISFSPSSIGTKSVIMRIDYGSNQNFEVNLTGEGILADGLMLLPNYFDFGENPVGEASEVNITLNNGTDENLVVNVAEIQGSDAASFSIVSGGSVPIEVSAYSVHVFTVQFKPVSEGNKNVMIHIELNDGITILESNLMGFGSVSSGIEVTPPNFDFGNVGLKATVSSTFTVKNTGNGNLVLTSISIADDLYNNYEISEGVLVNPITLSPSETHVFAVAFTPLSTGNKAAKFSISFLGDGSPLLGDLSGSGSDIPTISPDNHDFGSIHIGEPSAPFTFTFTNPNLIAIDVTNIAITGADASAFTSDPTGAGVWTVDSEGGTLQISVTFTPTKPGQHNATLNVTAGNVYFATLSGTGIEVPSFEIDPPSAYNFGSVITGTNESFEFTVTNNGTGVLSLITVELLNNSEGNFEISSGGSGSDVQPGATHKIRVTFMPQTNGNKSSTMRIVHNAPGSPASISLTGEGSNVALSPGNWNFGNVEVGTTSSPQTFIVTNSTASNITISNISFTGPDAARFNSVPSGTINQVVTGNGGTYQFNVTCTPTTTGVITATLTVVYNLGSLYSNVNAEGIENPVLNITPTSKDFGNVRLGSDAYQNFVITNSGTGTLVLTTISLVNNSGGDYVIVSGGGSSINVTTGSHTIRIKFEPQAFGNQVATLRIVHNGTGSPTSPLDVSLTGNANGPDFILVPDVSAYAFGDSYVGKSKEKLFYIKNGGDQTLTMSSFALSNSRDYTIIDVSAPVNIPAGNTIAIFKLVFTPVSTGNRASTLTITHNSVNPPHTISITGVGLAAPGEINENFDSGNPSTWGYSGDWEWGRPINTGPSRAHSGAYCFGTNINGNYHAYQNCFIVSPIIDLSNAQSPTLSFYMYTYCYSSDGGWVEYSTDGGNTWSRNLSPSPSYNAYVNGGSAYSGSRRGWELVTIDLSAAAGQSQVQIAWYFYSNRNWQTSGWYIDTVKVEDTAIPYPNTPVPYDNDINVIPTTNTFTLQWDADGANTYDVFLSQTYPPTSKVANAISSKSYNATVTAGRKYFWKVVANHPNSVIRTSQVWYFETVAAVPDVLINECDTRSSVDWVEIFNSANAPVYIGGWQLTIYADNNNYPDGVFTFPIGTVLQPYQLVVVNDNQAATNIVYRTNFNIEWANATSPGEVILQYPAAYNSKGVDYMKFNTLYNHKPADLSWSGTLTSNNTGLSSWYRNTSTDTDSSADWRVRGVSPDKGVKNPGQ